MMAIGVTAHGIVSAFVFTYGTTVLGAPRFSVGCCTRLGSSGLHLISDAGHVSDRVGR